MNLKLKRRSFLKMTATASAVALGSQFFALTNAKGSESPKQYVTEKMTWCEMCFWGCGVKAKVVGGKVKKLEGQELCPKNTGSLCARGNAGVYLTYDPDRLKKPLLNVGKRGEGKFKEVSWDEAIDFIANRLQEIIKRYGAKSVAWSGHGTGKYAWKEFMHLIGSPNVVSPSFSQCLGSREVAWSLTYGSPFAESYDAEFTKCMMFIGRNILESLQVGETKAVINGLSNGAKLIYVDPRYTKTAAKADIYMKIKPGTDMALILSMINFIINNNLYDKEFVENYCSGFEELKESVKIYTTDWAENETEIPASLIEEACRELAKAAPHCFVHPGRRTTRYGNDTQVSRAIAILNGLLGNIEVPGGIFKSSSISGKNPSMCGYSGLEEHKDEKRVDGAGTKYPFSPASLGLANQLISAMASGVPYPIKAFFGYCSSIFNYAADHDLIKKAISNLDLMVTCDVYLNEMALYSDVVLPESSYLERSDPIMIVSDKTPYIRIREQAIKPMFDTLGAWEIVTKLCKKLEKDFWFKSVEEYNKEFVEKMSLDMNKLKRDGVILKEGDPYRRYQTGKIKFNTPSGKVELVSSKMKQAGFDPLPKYEQKEQPSEDEFRLLFGRESFHTHARTQNINWLMAMNNYRCNIWIPKQRAEKMGIRTGDKVVIVKGDVRSDICFAYVTDKIHNSAIFLPHGYGRFSKFMKTAYSAKGASDVKFCSADVDEISGCAAFHNAFVRIEKA